MHSSYCSTIKPNDVQEDHVYLNAFPHSLEDKSKDWLYYITPKSITSQDNLKRMFLEKFFPTSRTTAIRKDISSIKQKSRESLYEYCERMMLLLLKGLTMQMQPKEIRSWRVRLMSSPLLLPNLLQTRKLHRPKFVASAPLMTISQTLTQQCNNNNNHNLLLTLLKHML